MTNNIYQMMQNEMADIRKLATMRNSCAEAKAKLDKKTTTANRPFRNLLSAQYDSMIRLLDNAMGIGNTKNKKHCLYWTRETSCCRSNNKMLEAALSGW